MAQVRALIWLRLRMLLARAGGKPTGVVIQAITFLLLMVGALGVYSVLLLLFRGLPRQNAVEVLYAALAGVWVLWIMIPLIVGSFDDSTDLSKLLLYPMAPTRMTLAVLLSDLAAAPIGWTVLLSVPMGWTHRAADAPIALAAVLLFALHMVAMVEALRMALWDLLRSRRTRDWLILLSPIIGIALYAGQNIAFRSAFTAGPAAWLSWRPSRYVGFLPSGIVVRAVANASAGRYAASLAFLALLLALTAATVAAMAVLVRRLQAGEAESGGHKASTPARQHRRVRRWVAIPIPEAVATVARKDMLLFWRDPHLKVRVMQAAVFPVMWVFIMVFFSPGGAGLLGGGTQLFLMATAMMLFGSFFLSANAFGPEGNAAGMLFLFPTSRHAMLAGKNAALWAVLTAFYAPALTLLAALGHRWSLLPVALLGAATTLLLALGIGDLLSVYAPYRMPARRQNPFARGPGGPGCIGFILYMAGYLATSVLAIPLAAAFIVPMAIGRPAWYVLALPAAIAYTIFVYRALLGLAAKVLQRREPEIIEAVGSRGPQTAL